MDSQISFRFFTVMSREPGQLGFLACLKKLMGLGDNAAREVDETEVQASNLQEVGDRISI